MTIDVTSNSWRASWQDSAISGVPQEQYFLKCVESSGNCDSSALATSNKVNRGIKEALINGLSPETNYKCYAIAENTFGSICSSPVNIMTYPDLEVVGTYYVDPTDGNDGSNGLTPETAVKMFAQAEAKVTEARNSKTGTYSIKFVSGEFDYTSTITVTISDLEITSEDESDPTTLNFNKIKNGIVINSQVSGIYLHDLKLTQKREDTDDEAVIAMQLVEDTGIQVPQNIWIYSNIIQMWYFGKIALV